MACMPYTPPCPTLLTAPPDSFLPAVQMKAFMRIDNTNLWAVTINTVQVGEGGYDRGHDRHCPGGKGGAR